MTSRRTRLSGSEGTCDSDYSPSDADWVSIEKAYRHKLDSGTRAEVIALVKEYLLWEGFERNTPFVNDAIEWLNRLSERGEAFYRELCFSAGESKRAAAAWQAAIYIEEHLKQSRLGEVNQTKISLESWQVLSMRGAPPRRRWWTRRAASSRALLGTT